MILWWRKATVDLAGCPQDKVTDVSEKLKMKLNAMREEEDYYDALVTAWNLSPTYYQAGLDYATTGFQDNGEFKNFTFMGEAIGEILWYLNDPMIV